MSSAADAHHIDHEQEQHDANLIKQNWADSIKFLLCQKYDLVNSALQFHHSTNSFYDKVRSIEIFLIQNDEQRQPSHLLRLADRIKGRLEQNVDYTPHLLIRAGVPPVDRPECLPNLESELDLFAPIAVMPEYMKKIREYLERPIAPGAPPLNTTLVPLSCHEERYTHNSVQDFLVTWQGAEHSERAITLTGDYGQGKTTTLLHTCYSLLSNKAPLVPIPIYVRLAGLDIAGRSLQSLLAEWFTEYQIDTQVGSYLLNSGRAVLILDGFDEIDLRGRHSRILSSFNKLFRLCEEYPIRIIIAGRAKFFDTVEERRNALRVGSSISRNIELNFLTNDSACKLFSIINPASSADFEGRVAIAESVFIDLIKRPIVLVQLAASWREIKVALDERGQFTSVVVRTFIDSIFTREYAVNEKKLSASFLSEGEVRLLTYIVAAQVGNTNAASAGSVASTIGAALGGISSEVTLSYRYNESQESQPPRERAASGENWLNASLRDFIARGIVERDVFDDSKLRFSHKSFGEYMRAELLVYRLYGYATDAKRAKVLEAVSIHSTLRDQPFYTITREEMDFAADLMAEAIKPAREKGDFTEARSIFALTGSSTWMEQVFLAMRHSNGTRFSTKSFFKWFARQFPPTGVTDIEQMVEVLDWDGSLRNGKYLRIEADGMIKALVAHRYSVVDPISRPKEPFWEFFFRTRGAVQRVILRKCYDRLASWQVASGSG